MTSYTLQDIYGDQAISDEEFEARLNRSLNPRHSDMLYDKLAVLGVGSEHAILDIGCRDAQHSCRLAQRFGCHVLAMDPLDDHIRRAQHIIAAAGLTERVVAVKGSIEALPADNASIDYIWCRDVLNHVTDLSVGLAECARVLKPGGSMLVYQTFATDLLEPRETAFLYERLAFVPSNMRHDFFEATCRAVGLVVAEKDLVGSEWREAWEEDGTRVTSNQLLQIARMRRDRDRLVAELGEKNYEAGLANNLWGVYQMLGKLCPTVYVVRKP